MRNPSILKINKYTPATLIINYYLMLPTVIAIQHNGRVVEQSSLLYVLCTLVQSVPHTHVCEMCIVIKYYNASVMFSVFCRTILVFFVLLTVFKHLFFIISF